MKFDKNMSESEIYQEIVALLAKLFELNPEDIQPESKLYEELDLDSIDAVDVVVQLQKQIGKKIQPELFRSVRTVQDVVVVVKDLLNKDA